MDWRAALEPPGLWRRSGAPADQNQFNGGREITVNRAPVMSFVNRPKFSGPYGRVAETDRARYRGETQRLHREKSAANFISWKPT